MFLPVAILIIFGGWLLAQSSIENTLQPNLHNETDFVALANFSLTQELAVTARHIRSLVNETSVQDFYRSDGKVAQGPIVNQFRTLLMRNPNYRSVRWVDQRASQARWGYATYACMPQASSRPCAMASKLTACISGWMRWKRPWERPSGRSRP